MHRYQKKCVFLHRNLRDNKSWQKQKHILERIALATDNYRFEDVRTVSAEFDASASDNVVMANTKEMMAKLAKE